MKVILIQPGAKTGTSLGVRKAPSSIMHLGGQLKREGFEVVIQHAPVSEGLVGVVKESCAEFVGISTMTSNFRDAEKLARMLKSAAPGLPIILGGWHASGCAAAYLIGQERETIGELLGPNTPFDVAVFGEGELVLPELLRRLKAGRDVLNLPGLGQFKDGRVVINPRAIVKDLNSVADPIYEGLSMETYRDLRSGALDLSIHFQRGCPWGCSFCATPVTSGKKLRSLGIERVIGHLVYLAETFKPSVITFTNEDPLLNLQYFKRLVSRLNEIKFNQKYGINIDIFASVVDIHRIMSGPSYSGLMQDMKHAGVSSFTIGIESFNPKILRKFNKLPMILATMSEAEKRDFDEMAGAEQDCFMVSQYRKIVQETVSYAYRHGILCVGDYMIGNPGETTEEVVKGFELFSGIRNLLVAYIPTFTPYPGTEIWRECYPYVSRGSDGKIAWELFDAAHVSFANRITAGLREELELGFYTSARYFEDAKKAIADGVLSTGFFINRFEFILRTFGDSDLTRLASKRLETFKRLAG